MTNDIELTIQPGNEPPLEEAHCRYESFIGICEEDLELAAADRRQYPELLRTAEDGGPLFDNTCCARFMHLVTGIDLKECLLFVHREDIELADSWLVKPEDKDRLRHSSEKWLAAELAKAC